MSRVYWLLLMLTFTTGGSLGYAYMEATCPTKQEMDSTRIENRELRKFINSRCGKHPGAACNEKGCPLDKPQRIPKEIN
jgi:hypothetical protein